MTQANFGLIGLGTMGSNLALNIAEKGNVIAVFNRTVETTRQFHADAGPLADRIVPAETLEAFVQAIAPPRAIILLVPAGPVVDSQIAALAPLLDEGDIIIDAGNANFHDSNRRAEAAKDAPWRFVGLGVSGGSEGARHGPSLMGGGDRQAWDRIAPVMEAIAASHEGQPCATYMGEAGAGHFVKMVHNGIEYADMQMIGEVYGMMRDGLDMTANDIAAVFARWNQGPLKSYLIEISAEVASVTDPKSDLPILDVILDSAGQKGTGRWTAVEALHLAAPVSTIDAAVTARNLSSRLDERKTGEKLFGAAPQRLDTASLPLERLESALLAGKIACYAQGFSMLAAASDEFGWALPLPDVAKVWRAGCIIRSAMLDDMATALEANPGRNLMYSDFFAARLKESHADLRQVVGQAVMGGNPVPALANGLAYFDMMRTARSTANMIQAQRDFFGAHGFERIDEAGSFHGPWASGH